MKSLYNKFKAEVDKAIFIRSFEEKLLNLFSEGKLNGTVHTAVGQEFTPIFISKYLNDTDYVTSNHRGHAHYLAQHDKPFELLSEIMGKESGTSGGRGGSQHIVDENFMSNGIQGGMLPIAAGVSYFYKLKNYNSIALSYIGDGTLGEGIVYEVFNLASVLELPLCVVIENNGYAQSTSFKQTFSGSMENRAKGFGIKYFKCASNDLERLDDISKKALNYVRNNTKPAIIEVDTYRLKSHSKGDDNRYSSEVELAYKNDLLSKVIVQEELKPLLQKIDIKLTEIVKKADESLTLKNVESPQPLYKLPGNSHLNPGLDSSERFNSLIYKALKKVLKNNEDSILIGEDIQGLTKYTEKEYGGAFKVTRNLSELFASRVFNSPISEAAIYGFASGYSIKGGRSYVEIMFGDFTTLIFDQVLQHSSKFELMYNGKVKCPVTIRTPMGGKRGYGPTHSQSIEKHFLGIPNFAVIALNHRINPEYIYDSLHSLEVPSMIVENKILYTLTGNIPKLPDYVYSYSNSLFPTLKVIPNSRYKAQVRIYCYGEMLHQAEKAALELMLEEEIFCEIFCPSLISETCPDIHEISNDVELILIAEEGSGFASWGSEILSKVIANNQSMANKKIIRVSNNHFIPSSYSAEANLIPDYKTIISSIQTNL